MRTSTWFAVGVFTVCFPTFAWCEDDTFQETLQKAEQGDMEAQNVMGVYHHKGWGVSKNDVKAVKWFRLSAEQGYANAQYNLSVYYLRNQTSRKR